MPKTLRFNSATMPDQEKFKIIIYGSIMAFLASFVSSLMSKEKNTWDKVRTFLAGSCAGILFQLIFLDFTFSQGWKNIISSVVSAFITVIWPAFERLISTVILPFFSHYIEKYLKKKGNDNLPDSKPDK